MHFNKFFLSLLFLTLSLFSSGNAQANDKETIIVGNIPHRYIKTKGNKKYQLGFVHIKNRIIQGVEPLSASGIKKIKKAFPEASIIHANKEGKITNGEKYDFLYPGLIDLHNHTKQNNLGVWDQARGQFKNRFEWRAWSVYKYSVSGNMNPWIGYGIPITCAAFRWSELQAMILGVTYLQGPSSCINDFGIHRVENRKSYVSKKAAVQAPTDLVIPADMTYVWQVLRPLIKSGLSYEQALAQEVNASCEIPGISAKTVNTPDGLKKLKDKALLKEKCTKKELHPKFFRYVYWIHPTVAGRKNYLARPDRSAVIAHLSEGRRDDPYNQTEYETMRLLGLEAPYVNFVHGVGIKSSDLKRMGKKKMGLIWSLYSNLLLYGQTLNIKAAKKAGVKLALGSDWLPTGSRGVLEELKIAAAYIDKDPLNENLKEFNDEELFLMVTENPAQMINHFEISPGEAGIGQIRKGAMGTIISATKLINDPYTNLVRKVWSKDLNMVVVDGDLIYGNENYLSQAGIKRKQYEQLPMFFKDIEKLKSDKRIGILPEKEATKESKSTHLERLGSYVAKLPLRPTDNCNFDSKKGFVHQSSIQKNAHLAPFYKKTGLNLDRVSDIQKLLSINMLTQSRNLNEPTKGNLKFAIRSFPPLYSCHDENYIKRLTRFISSKARDEYEHNIENVEELRKKQKLGAVPKKLAREYAQ